MISKELNEIVINLAQIEQEDCIPKNIKLKIKNAVVALENNAISKGIKIDKALQELDNLDDDPNLPTYIRTQIWNVVTLLESK